MHHGRRYQYRGFAASQRKSSYIVERIDCFTSLFTNDTLAEQEDAHMRPTIHKKMLEIGRLFSETPNDEVPMRGYVVIRGTKAEAWEEKN